MEAIKITGRVDEADKIQISLPLALANQTVEITIHPVMDDIPRDALGWPIGFFERTYGALADDPIERPDES